MSKIIANNIKKLRSMYNLSQKDLAEIAGVTDKAVSTWENDIKEPRMGAIQKIADNFGLLKSNLIEEDGLINLSFNQFLRETSLETMPTLKVYGKICAGNGKLAYENILEEIVCPYPKVHGDMIALQVDGESMNKIIPNGVYAIIKLQNDVENGQIVAVIIDNENAMLKRFYRVDEETVMLKPESTEDYSAITFMKDDINKIKIIGKYIGHVSPCME